MKKINIAYNRRKRYYYAYPYYVWLAGLVAKLRKGKKPYIPVLLYHSVSSDFSPDFSEQFNVSPTTFERHMNWLFNQGYVSLSPSDLLDIAEGREAPDKSFVLTFDDGYRNNVTTALPIIKKYGFKAIFFVATAFIGNTEVYPWLKSSGNISFKEYGPMDEEQIRELSEAGMFIGAHSHNHQNMIELDDEESSETISNSVRILRDISGQSVETFAFPYGGRHDFTDVHTGFCLESGCKLVFSTISDYIDPQQFNPLSIPRFTVIERDNPKAFELKVSGMFKWFEKFRFTFLMPFRVMDRILNSL